MSQPVVRVGDDAIGVNAHADADAAAERAAVRVEMLHRQDDIEAAVALLDSVWAPTGAGVSSAFLRSLEHGGNYVAAAYHGAELRGASAGFFVEPLGATLHSHITGVVPSSAGRGVGRALKMHQRAWALDRGLTTVTWTFDPLIARNAFFNIARLGARPTEYLVDFYGRLGPATPGGEASDRVLVEWDLAGARIGAAAEAISDDPGSAVDGRIVLDGGADGRPQIADPVSGSDRMVLARIPADVPALREADAGAAAAWRTALRQVMAPLLESGTWAITDFRREGWYVFERLDGGDS